MNFADPRTTTVLSKGRLLALDPGTGHPAIASFKDAKLIVAARVKLPGTLTKLGRLERARAIAELVVAQALSYTNGEPYDNLVCEMPQIYNHGKSKGDPNKILLLALVVAAVAGKMGIPCTDFLPSEWIGQIPKSTKAGEAWTSARGVIIKSRLRDEWTLCAPDNDSVDATGVGLKAVGRLDRNVFPGST